jgi:anaerobic ribonucleoside-triphosphate reductase
VSPTRIAKRDGREVPFDEEKIRSAVARAQAAVGEDDAHLPAEVATLVRLTLAAARPRRRRCRASRRSRTWSSAR